MRILLVSDFFPPQRGGMERHIRDLARHLKRRGHNVCVNSTQYHPSTDELLDEIDVHRFDHLLGKFPYIYTTKSKRFHPPTPDPLMTRSLEKIVSTFRPDVIHAHGWIMYSAIKVGRSHRVPVVITLHDYGFVCPARTMLYQRGVCPYTDIEKEPTWSHVMMCAASAYGAPRGLLMGAAMSASRRLLFSADQFIAVSNYVSVIAKKAGIENVEVIPNFVDSEELLSCARSGISSGSGILYIGDLDPIKGVNVLRKAYRGLRQTGVGIELTMIGFPSNYAMPRPGPGTRIISAPDRSLVVSYLAGRSKMVVVPSIC